MRRLLLALALGAVSLTVGLVVLLSRDEVRRRAGDPPQEARPAPTTVCVLAGSEGGLEVLVKPRFLREDHQAFGNRALCRSLGLAEETWQFLQLVVLNLSDDPVMVDAGALVLERKDGTRIPVKTLRSLCRDTGAALPILRAHDPDRRNPLGPRGLRTLLVAVPRAVRMEGVAGGRLGSIPLRPGRAVSNKLEGILGQPRPPAPLLAAVLELEERGRREETPDSEKGGRPR